MHEAGKDLEARPPTVLPPVSFLPGSQVQGSSSSRASSADAVNKEWVPTMNPPPGNSSSLTFLKPASLGLPSQVLGVQSSPDKGAKASGTAKRHSFNYSLLSDDPLGGFSDFLRPQDDDRKFTNASASTTTGASKTMLSTKGNEFKSCGNSKVRLPLHVTKANPSDGASRLGATGNAGGRGNAPLTESNRMMPFRTFGVDQKPALRDGDNLKWNAVVFKDGGSSQNGHRFVGNKNCMSLLTSGRNTHRGIGDANTLKFTK